MKKVLTAVFIVLTYLLITMGIICAAFNTPEAHAGSYQETQLMQRLVKAEEDQARALQQIVNCLERMK